MTKITNTEKQPSFEWLLGGNPKAIEQQEAQGQKKLVQSDQLPAKNNGWKTDPARIQYGKMGIKVIGETEGDPLFLDVELPAGWKKVATDHSMWCNLIDEKGRKRANIFYKAAFYDRSAHVDFTNRYYREGTSPDYDIPYTEREHYHHVIDRNTGNVIFRTESYFGDNWEKNDENSNICNNWLKENFPDHENPNAYWD